MNSGTEFERRGLHSALEFSWFYAAIQRALGSRHAARIIERDYLDSMVVSEAKILDIGCGPARLLCDHPSIEPSRLVGVEPNIDYVRSGQQQFPSARFHHGTPNSLSEDIGEQFDFVILSGVIHHLDDESASQALKFAKRHLSASGIVFTLDAVFTVPQRE